MGVSVTANVKSVSTPPMSGQKFVDIITYSNGSFDSVKVKKTQKQAEGMACSLIKNGKFNTVTRQVEKVDGVTIRIATDCGFFKSCKYPRGDGEILIHTDTPLPPELQSGWTFDVIYKTLNRYATLESLGRIFSGFLAGSAMGLEREQSSGDYASYTGLFLLRSGFQLSPEMIPLQSL